nr:MAG TPA: hypothetical protein [Caudoviricetes sp.]
MIDRILKDAIEEYDGILPEEAVSQLVPRWRTRIKFQSVPMWAENLYAFLDFAAGNGYKPGMMIFKFDTEKPYGPHNCYFSTKRNAPPSKRIDPETPEERWDRCVYEFNRERVAAYKKHHK